ncbi:MAG TPA: helix-hairpin-helix domain-containing protein, partial [Anseongella sp.]|nr:helix-hairpin-helix domain-containing protein [Anseongella sp.]
MSRLHQIALTMLPGIGDVLARSLLDHYGSAEAVFRESARDLVGIPGIGERIAASITARTYASVLKQAETELNFAEKQGIRLVFYLDKGYPRRLRNCHDAPVMLY